jgi:hypothetical protein
VIIADERPEGQATRPMARTGIWRTQRVRMESAMIDLISLTIGIVLLIAALALLRWASPRDGRPNRIPDKWGLTMIVPMTILTIGVAGLMFAAKAFF